MDKCVEIERLLKKRADSSYVLKPNESAKAAVWKQFSLVFEKQLPSDEGETLCHVKYLCACNKCLKGADYITDVRSMLSADRVEAIEIVRSAMSTGLADMAQ